MVNVYWVKAEKKNSTLWGKKNYIYGWNRSTCLFSNPKRVKRQYSWMQNIFEFQIQYNINFTMKIPSTMVEWDPHNWNMLIGKYNLLRYMPE